MVVMGIVSGVETKERDGVALTNFRLRSPDGRETQAQTASTAPLKNGAMIQAEGTIDSELVLIATSITYVGKPNQETGTRWKPILLIGAAVLVIVIGVIAWAMTRSGFTKQTSLRFESPNARPALIKSSPDECELACKQDAQCAKYTWVRPDGIVMVARFYGHQPTCWLLPTTATQSTASSDATMGAQPDCCTSAVKK